MGLGVAQVAEARLQDRQEATIYSRGLGHREWSVPNSRSVEERKHELELSTSYELLQFQANLATATRKHLRAVIDYRKSIVALYQAFGVTLEKLNIELE